MIPYLYQLSGWFNAGRELTNLELINFLNGSNSGVLPNPQSVGY